MLARGITSPNESMLTLVFELRRALVLSRLYYGWTGNTGLRLVCAEV